MLLRPVLGGRKHPASRQRRCPSRPCFETLEDRCLLSFSPGVSYAAGLNPAAVATAFLNGDDALDLVIVNQGSNSVSIWLGQGDGTFDQGPTDFPTGSGPRSIAVGDFDGDDITDLATANQSGGSVSVLLGNGDGSFQPPQDKVISGPTTFGTPAVVAGDVDGDGNIDLVASSVSEYSGYYGGIYYQSYANVLLGDGTGGFAAPVAYPIPGSYYYYSAPLDIALGDVTADGQLDVVTANAQGNVGVLPGNGNGTFQFGQSYFTGGGTQSVALADFNGDTKLDVAAASGASQTGVSVLLNDGAGSLQPAQFYVTGSVPLDVVAADFNGDGQLDLATANGGTSEYIPAPGVSVPVQGSVSVLLNKGNGTFTLPVSVAAASTALGTEDFNGDTRPDLVATSVDASVFLNDGAWPELTAPSLSVANANVAEGNAATADALFIVTLSASSTSEVRVDFATADGSASEDSDYAAQTGTLIFVPGQTTQIITVLVNGDRLGEGNEGFTITLRNPINAFLGDAHAVGVIQDDEPRVSISDVVVSEGNTGVTEAKFTVSLATAYDVDVMLAFATAAGSAAPGSDFEDQAGTLTIPANETTQLITVLVAGDRVFEQTEVLVDDGYGGYYIVLEDNEFFGVNLSGLNYGIFLDASGRGTIQDDEPRISVGDATVTEGNTGTTEAKFTVSIAAAYDVDVTVAYATGDVGFDPKATAGSDYVAKSDTVTIPAGQTSQTFSVLVNGDLIVESGFEYFNVSLNSPNYGGIIDGFGLGRIDDDEPSVSVKSVEVKEGNTGAVDAVFIVKLSTPSKGPVTVAYTTADGGAKAGSDYVTKSGTLTFKPGQLKKTVSVSVKGDFLDEYDEDFYLNLTDGAGGRVLNVVRAAIDDNDPLPRLRISDASAIEGHTGPKLLGFTVTLSAASGKDVWVDYHTENGTARRSDNDYERSSGQIHFAPGETTKLILVVINGDQKSESSEQFYLDLSHAYGAVIDDGLGIGTIRNDD